jgi:hypothetical protein
MKEFLCKARNARNLTSFKTITMKTFGVVGEENKNSTRKKMPKRLFCP